MTGNRCGCRESYSLENKNVILKMKNILKKNKGITLIALVITIIILLILAGVSINLIFGEDGILNKSKTAVEKYENSSKEEAQKLEEISNLIAGYEKTITVENLQPGDFVNYSAGTWQTGEITALTNAGLYAGESLPSSETPFQFGGFKAGDSKDASITPYSTYANTYSGWRILKIENGVITIVHAGTPEGYYQPYGTGYGYRGEYILAGTAGYVSYANGSNIRDWSMYEDGNLAETGTAHCMTYDEAYAITGSTSATDNSLRKTGSYYWLASASGNNGHNMWYVINDGEMRYGNGPFGVRPVVTLKSNVKVIKGTGTVEKPYELAIQ